MVNKHKLKQSFQLVYLTVLILIYLISVTDTNKIDLRLCSVSQLQVLISIYLIILTSLFADICKLELTALAQ